MTSNEAESALQPGALFGQYQIVRLLGHGGMGAVYQALHTKLDKTVALKTLHPRVAAIPEAAARFDREGRATAKIRHPHVVDVSDVGAHDGVVYLVMEFLEGEDLAHLIARDGALTPARTAEIMLPVLSAVGAAHEAGVLHRDLKPENVFLARGRHGSVVPKVLDFGISKLVDDASSKALTGTSAVFGTPYYMSPEQASGSKSVDPRSDQYSLGVILYECLTGERPFEHPTLYGLIAAIFQGEARRPSAVRAGLGVEIDELVMRAIARTPEARFPTLRALGTALLPFATARVRALWEAEFAPSADGAAAETASPPAALPGATPATLVLPSPHASVDSAAAVAVATSVPGTMGQPSHRTSTLGQSAREIDVPRTLETRRAHTGRWIAVALGVCLVLGVAAFALRPSATPHAAARPIAPSGLAAAVGPSSTVPSTAVGAPGAAPAPPAGPPAAPPAAPPAGPPAALPAASPADASRAAPSALVPPAVGSRAPAAAETSTSLRRDRGPARTTPRANPSSRTTVHVPPAAASGFNGAPIIR